MLSCIKTAAFGFIATALAEQTFEFDAVESQIVERMLDTECDAECKAAAK